MSLSLGQRRIRLSVDPYSHDALTCRLQGSVPKIWRGTDTYIEIGMYLDGVFVDTSTGISAINVDILPANDRDAAPLLQKTDASIDTISEADWTGNTASKYHARVALSRSETQFDMTNAVDNILSLWIVIHALMATGEYITLGAGQLLVEEDGAQNGLSAITAAVPAARLSDGELQLYDPDAAAWRTIMISGGTLALGPAE